MNISTHGPSIIPSAKLPPQMAVQGYVTAFIDLLGMSRQFLVLEQDILATTDADSRKSRAAEVFVRIHEIRREIEHWYSTIDSPERIEKLLGRLPPEARESMGRSRQHGTTIQWFGDCIVVSVPLHEDTLTLCQGILTLFIGSAYVSFCQLAHGRPTRGGIDLGIGCELSRGEIVGASVAKAYSLEQNACDPCIVLGNALLKILNELEAKSATTPEDGLVKGMVGLIRRYTMTVGGRTLIDPCSEAFLAGLGKPAEALSQSIREFVAAQLQSPVVLGDQRLLSKYEWLKRMVVDRMPAC